MSNKEISFPDGDEEIIPVWRRRAKKRPSSSEKKPDIMVFHERVKATGTYEQLSEREQMLMEAYFTTPATYEDLRHLAGGVSAPRVRKIINHGLTKLWYRYLPQEIREEYKRELPEGGGRVQHFKLPNKRGKRKG